MITVTELTGFRARAPIIILDAKGRIFYHKESGNRNGFVDFNLPAGNYTCNVPLEALRRPLQYVCPKLPKPETNRPIPKEIRIEVKPNPHKCSIYFNKGLIVIDPEYAAIPLPNLLHILFHEVGHFLYVTEWKCDLFSCVNMLKYGMNPSQCLRMMLHNLGNREETISRGRICNNFLNKVKAT